MREFSYIVDMEVDVGKRVDQFLAEKCAAVSRSRLQRLIVEGRVQKNGEEIKKARDKIDFGDVVKFFLPEEKKWALEGEEMPLDILYEDEDVIVINKDSGVVVHPGAGRERGTLVQGLLYHCNTLSSVGGDERPGIVHRLDGETSGVMVVAKNDVSHVSLSDQFRERRVKKIYYAVSVGSIAKESGCIETHLDRHPENRIKRAVVLPPKGKKAVTLYRSLLHSGPEGTVFFRCELLTGRTHQIRVHLQSLGCPILGDRWYAPKRVLEKHAVPRLMLHAYRLCFFHPRSGRRLCFVAPLPKEFLNWAL